MICGCSQRQSLPPIHSLRPPPVSASAAPEHDARFVNTAQSAGLRYHWSVPGKPPHDILQTIGNGCAFLDYDNDGILDVLLVGPRLALYMGDGRGHFTDVTHAMGLDKLHGHFLGCAVGDYDNDGYDDIYLSGYRAGLLLHNEHGQGFRDVTRQAGLKPQAWGTSCAWADVDGDGRLDLYVGGYLCFDPAADRRICPMQGHLSGCPPETFAPAHGSLYLNSGRSSFREATQSWAAGRMGKTLGVAFAAYDSHSRVSLYLGNDTEPGELLRNVGGLFQDVGRRSGTAYDHQQQSKAHGGMGVDWGDYDNDGKMDLAVATFSTQPKCIYRNLGDGEFTEISDRLGLDSALANVAFGVKWLDCDNKGWLDLMLTNGDVDDDWRGARQPTQLFYNVHGRRFDDVSRQAGAAFTQTILGRGLAIGDYDNDGRVDALVVDSEGRPLLLHNESRPAGHWLTFRLEGTQSNRDGYGATVTVTAGGLTQTRLCHADGSYLSSSEKRVHVGLGKAVVADAVTIRWPSGHTDAFLHVQADRILTVREGAAALR